MYQITSDLLYSLEIDCDHPLELLRILVISECAKKHYPKHSGMAVTEIILSSKIQDYLFQYNIPSVNEAEANNLWEKIDMIRRVIPNSLTFQKFFSDAFPFQLKDNTVIELLKDDLLSLFTCLYCLYSASRSYAGADAFNGTRFIFEVYLAEEPKWAELGITDIESFIRCWQSINYFECKEEHEYVPRVLEQAIASYKKHKIPKTVLMSHFARLDSMRHRTLDSAWETGEFDPWMEYRKSEKLPMVERGMTLQEELFNNSIYNLVNSGVRATDVVNAIFYKKRKDSLVEKNILFPSILMDIASAENVLVINPSPDFLTTYADEKSTSDRRTTFIVPHKDIATAYANQFLDKEEVYRFVVADQGTDKLDSNHEKNMPVYDYVIFMARDSSMESYANVFSKCKPNARIVCFVPQTFFSSKGDKMIRKVFNDNGIYIDSILEIPNALVQSKKRKKMIFRAHVGGCLPNAVALISSDFYTTESNTSNRDDKRRSTEKKLVRATNYITTQPVAFGVPYEVLTKKWTLNQMRNYHDQMLYEGTDYGVSRRHYNKGSVFNFSKEIAITINLYPQADGRYKIRAYRRFVSKQYGYSVRKGQGNNRRIRTKYYETGPCSLEEVYVRITRWMLSPEVVDEIGRDIEAHYRNNPEDLSLKTVWYCNRRELESVYMTYDDELAIQLFCEGDNELTNLLLRDVTESIVLDALQASAPDSETDQRYRRLLDQIFRVAVKRGFMEVNPLSPVNTALDYDRKKAMRHLRDALGKDSLEISQLWKIISFLLEPVDEQGTKRAVKDSRWLVPLIRLCTGMPIREICALQWKDFRQIEDLNAYQLYVTRLLNDANEPIQISNYRFVKQYRKVPCVSILSGVLRERLQYIDANYGLTLDVAMEHPMIYAEEPGKKKSKGKGTPLYQGCTINQARKVSAVALGKAEIQPRIINLLDGDESFCEDLNASRNDLFYSNFVHYANQLCSLSEGELCYIVGRKGPNCFAEHYVDYRNDFIQIDMVQRLNRLWAVACRPWQSTAEYKYFARFCTATNTVIADSFGGMLAAIDLSIIPMEASFPGDIMVHVECDHGVDGSIVAFNKWSDASETEEEWRGGEC